MAQVFPLFIIVSVCMMDLVERIIALLSVLVDSEQHGRPYLVSKMQALSRRTVR